MARKPKTVAEIDKEIEALKALKSKALENRANDIGKIAAKANLVSLAISDAELLKEFKEIANRFQTKTNIPAARENTAQINTG